MITDPTFVDYIAEGRKQIEEVKRLSKNYFEKTTYSIKKLEKKLDEHYGVMQQIAYIAGCSDETLGNVLLAIRQNEHLQAWYPAQDGRPEQKVVGRYNTRTTDVRETKKTKRAAPVDGGKAKKRSADGECVSVL